MTYHDAEGTMQILQCKPWFRKRNIAIGLAFFALVCMSIWVRYESEKPQRTTLLQYGLDYKQILLWKTEQQRYQWPYIEGDRHFLIENCEVDKCFFTYDKRLLHSSDAIMFHSTDVQYDEQFDDLLDERLPQQMWVYVDQEPPIPNESVSNLDGLFNMAMSYKADSDIVVPIGASVLTDMPFKIDTHSYKRQGTLVWVVSDCTLMDNENIGELIEALQRQLSVKIISQCPPDPDCVIYPDKKGCKPNYNTRDYKFQLIIESQSCNDYISNDFWDVLRQGTVPIVMGATLEDYISAAPPDSFLHVHNFSTPDALVNHLLRLTLDDEAYGTYFKWQETQRIKTLGEMSITSAHAVCQLCDMVHDSSRTSNYYFLSKWWSAEENCDANAVPFPSSYT